MEFGRGDLAGQVGEGLDNRLDLRGVEESIEPLDDERYAALPQFRDQWPGIVGHGPEEYGHVGPRESARWRGWGVLERQSLHSLDAVTDPVHLRGLVGEVESEQVTSGPLLVTARDHVLGQSLLRRDQAGHRLPKLDDALAGTEVLAQGHLGDIVVAIGEGHDVADLAAPPLVDRLVVVAHHAEVRAELCEASNQPLLQGVDVLVLVHDDKLEVIADMPEHGLCQGIVGVVARIEQLHREYRIEFDDMDTDWIPHGTIKRMLTAEQITDRILGVSKTATVSTRTLFLASGNNVGPVRDLLRRVLTIHVDPRCATPATLSYRGNPVEKVRQERGKYVSAVLTIIQAWRTAGSPRAQVSTIVTYGGA